MTLHTHTLARFTVVLLAGSLFLSACSGSGDTPASADAEGVDSDDINMPQSQGNVVDTGVVDVGSGQGTAQPEPALGTSEQDSQNVPDVVEVVSPDPVSSDPVIPDPLIQNSTRVDFDIEVPVYQSDALKVGLVWGDRDIAVSWVGDEFWSASAELPANTQQALLVTFFDDNGNVTLGSFETTFKTGTNSAEVYQISAEQFDTDRWDDDGDSVSNLDELIAGTQGSGSARVLLFSETRGYRHDSISNALGALEELALSASIQTERAGDSEGVFTDTNLASFDAVVWVLTSGDVLNVDEQAAFERYIRSGGGYAGIHAASDTEYDWPWYGSLVGAYFERHPVIQTATQNVENQSHLSTAHLGSSWTRTDEWYDYNINPRAQVNVLLSLEESSYSDGGMGEDHPSAWYHEYDGGRSWYTGGGHTVQSYSEPDFLAHLSGGLRYAAGLED